MSKDPAFLFYPGDFTGGTLLFTDEQLGKYLRLLLLQFHNGHLTEEDMLFICKTYDKRIFSKFCQDAQGLWFNKRLEIEVERRKNYVLSRTKNRSKKEETQKRHDHHMTDHMENENENENINEIKNADENENGKRGAGEKTKKAPEPALTLNPFQGELAEVWNDWEAHRKQKKAPLTPVARQRQIKLLKALTTAQAIAVINYSLCNGYTGLFPEQLQKEKTNGNSHPNAKQQADAQRRDEISNYIRAKAEAKKL
jgi:uncharacterized protein YdaU (DUF1376 family)